jgi:RNA polymerase-binding protein DksA
MKTAALEEQREKLIDMRRRIEREFNRAAEAIAQDIAAPGELSHLPTHPADQDVEGLDVEVAVGHTQDEMLEAIRVALARIDQGTYGQCEKCGRPISQERLRAVPYATQCVDCQRED